MVSTGKQEFIDTDSPNSYNNARGPLAQLAEQLTLNQQVTGSIPVRLTNFEAILVCPPKSSPVLMLDWN